MAAYEVITPPNDVAVTLSSAKDQLDYLVDDENVEITALIDRATRHVEELAGVRLMRATIKEYRDRFPSSRHAITLAVGPVASVNEITYINDVGTETLLDPSEYITDTVSVPARITPAWERHYPLARRQINSVAITYDAGHTSRDNLPQSSVQLILMFVRRWFDKCEGGIELDGAIHSLLLDLKGWARG